MKTLFRIALAGILLAVVCACSSVKRSAPEHQDAEHQESAKLPETLIGLQYELYRTPLNVGWGAVRPAGWVGLDNGTQEAIPILGKYSSYDVKILQKHEEWFEYLGVNWLLIDWADFLAAKPAWESQKGPTREVEETTELLLKTYSQLQKEGKHPPKIVIMLGFEHRPGATQRINQIIRWIDKNLLANPQYKNQWLVYQGKPLLTMLNVANLPCDELAKDTSGVVAPEWTVRWMGTQLQDNHVEQCGYWSWMDGTIRQAVTFRDHVAEETVVTPSCFPWPLRGDPAHNKGWLDPRATGRDHGAPYVESWKVAFESQPKFIQIHQWNEFAGAADGHGGGPNHDVYGDEYSLELSDDIEPTKLDGCGYRGCGGWGYYYVNLTKALISLYRKETPDITVLALSGPSQPAVVKRNQLPLTWNYLGKPPSSYTLKVDGETVAEDFPGKSYTLDLSRLSPGKHKVQLIANGVHTYFDLNPQSLTRKSNAPLPVTSTIEFEYAPTSQRK
ncbi:MAG TPA: hypothetical protein VMV34_08905 [Terriglobia bacterium]|nr:hypothetical protein [Terriglobia bacterium]